jgi:hypothetical protein
VSDPQTVEFHGESYVIAERVATMPLLRFAKLAQDDADSDDMSSLAAMYDLIEMCFDPADWARFQKAATKHKADGTELMGVVSQVFQVLAARPTQRPSDSSDGPPSIEPSSTSTHVDRAIAQLDGRPDLQLIIVKAQEAMAS